MKTKKPVILAYGKPDPMPKSIDLQLSILDTSTVTAAVPLNLVFDLIGDDVAARDRAIRELKRSHTSVAPFKK